MKRKILILGLGFIGKKLLDFLLNKNYSVEVVVRNRNTIKNLSSLKNLKIIIGDLKNPKQWIGQISQRAIIYYFIHGLKDSSYKNPKSLLKLEASYAKSLISLAKKIKSPKIIHLSGIYFDNEELSPHLQARRLTNNIIINSGIPYTILRSSIIFGKGSASYQILKKLVSSSKIIFIPKLWTRTKFQPVYANDVIGALYLSMSKVKTTNKILDIGGPKIYTLEALLKNTAKKLNKNPLFLKINICPYKLISLYLAYICHIKQNEIYFLLQSLENNSFACYNSLTQIFKIKPKKLFKNFLF